MNVASNNFSSELPRRYLTKWHAMALAKGTTGRPQFDLPIINPKAFPNMMLASFRFNYEEVVSVTNKGLEMKMVSIVPNGFTFIDFSSNHFSRAIPEEFEQLESLIILNLSNNYLGSQIPSSFGNLAQLECLDLSRNYLGGKIPASLSNLNFFSFSNVSYNQLVERIPHGNQIQTFSADRFQGNRGLCGPPLTPNCPGDRVEENALPKTRPDVEANHPVCGNEIEWNLISIEIGFFVGIGKVIGPLVFWNRCRR